MPTVPMQTHVSLANKNCKRDIKNYQLVKQGQYSMQASIKYNHQKTKYLRYD